MNFVVEHIGLAAVNPAVLKDWYARVLGARVLHATESDPGSFYLELPGGLHLEIYPGDFTFHGTRDHSCAGWRHLALRVDSIETARNHLAGLGVGFTEPERTEGHGCRALSFHDPEGNLLQLVEPAPTGEAAKPAETAGKSSG